MNDADLALVQTLAFQTATLCFLFAAVLALDPDGELAVLLGLGAAGVTVATGLVRFTRRPADTTR